MVVGNYPKKRGFNGYKGVSWHADSVYYERKQMFNFRKILELFPFIKAEADTQPSLVSNPEGRGDQWDERF